MYKFITKPTQVHQHLVDTSEQFEVPYDIDGVVSVNVVDSVAKMTMLVERSQPSQFKKMLIKVHDIVL